MLWCAFLLLPTFVGSRCVSVFSSVHVRACVRACVCVCVLNVRCVHLCFCALLHVWVARSPSFSLSRSLYLSLFFSGTDCGQTLQVHVSVPLLLQRDSRVWRECMSARATGIARREAELDIRRATFVAREGKAADVLRQTQELQHRAMRHERWARLRAGCVRMGAANRRNVDGRVFWGAVKARAALLAQRTADERVRAHELMDSARKELAAARVVQAGAAQAAASLASAAVQRALEHARAQQAESHKWSRVRSAMLAYAVTRRMKLDHAVFATVAAERLRGAVSRSEATLAAAQAEKARAVAKTEALEAATLRHDAEMRRREQQAQRALENCRISAQREQRKRLSQWRVARCVLMAAHRRRMKVRTRACFGEHVIAL